MDLIAPSNEGASAGCKPQLSCLVMRSAYPAQAAPDESIAYGRLVDDARYDSRSSLTQKKKERKRRKNRDS